MHHKRQGRSARRDERKATPEDRPAPERSPPYRCEYLPNRLIVLKRLAVSEGNACGQQLDLFGASMRPHVFHAFARARGSMTHDREHKEMRRQVFLGSSISLNASRT